MTRAHIGENVGENAISLHRGTRGRAYESVNLLGIYQIAQLRSQIRHPNDKFTFRLLLPIVIFLCGESRIQEKHDVTLFVFTKMLATSRTNNRHIRIFLLC